MGRYGSGSAGQPGDFLKKFKHHSQLPKPTPVSVFPVQSHLKAFSPAVLSKEEEGDWEERYAVLLGRRGVASGAFDCFLAVLDTDEQGAYSRVYGEFVTSIERYLAACVVLMREAKADRNACEASLSDMRVEKGGTAWEMILHSYNTNTRKVACVLALASSGVADIHQRLQQRCYDCFGCVSADLSKEVLSDPVARFLLKASCELASCHVLLAEEIDKGARFVGCTPAFVNVPL